MYTEHIVCGVLPCVDKNATAIDDDDAASVVARFNSFFVSFILNSIDSMILEIGNLSTESI